MCERPLPGHSPITKPLCVNLSSAPSLRCPTTRPDEALWPPVPSPRPPARAPEEVRRRKRGVGPSEAQRSELRRMCLLARYDAGLLVG